MLVLTRKINESIMIGDNIEIMVLDVRDNQVKIGIRAPRDVSIHRQEVYEEIKAENLRAQTSQTSSLDQAAKALRKRPYKRP